MGEETGTAELSVVIPTTGRVSLSAAVASVLAQTVPVREVVVVVDGHERRGAVDELVARFGGDSVRVVACPRQGIPGAVRNVGLATVVSSLVAFLDDDDEWEPGKLERQLPAFSPGVVAVASNAVSVGAGSSKPYFSTPIGGERFLRDFLWHNPLITSSVVCRTAALRRVGGFPVDPELVGIEDYVAWVKLASQGSVVVVDELLVRYAVGSPDSLSVRNSLSDPVVSALVSAAAGLRPVSGTLGARCRLRASLVRRHLRPRSRLREFLAAGRGR